MLPAGYEKKSFRRFDIGVDVERLQAEFAAIPQACWASSYWGSIHCSVGMLLLRGGTTGTQDDFYCDQIEDHEVLGDLPYIRSLLDESGPFGMASYAFIFRMQPKGVTLVHRDTMERWFDMYRIHIPIFTNPEAHLISDGRSIHFASGYAWSFDNQTRHGVVNGDAERVHLIMDVDFNARLKEQIDKARFLPGEENEEHMAIISSKERQKPSYFGDEVVRQGIARLRAQGMNDAQITAFFNHKKVPLKHYYAQLWTPDMIREIEAPGS
jgi:hypothetical protein